MATAGDRGKATEKAVQDYLKKVNEQVAEFDFERLPDARSAMGRMKAMAGDFEFFAPGLHGVIEAKETEHGFRLSPTKVSQLPRLKKRELAGGRCFILVFHSIAKLWRRVPAHTLPTITTGSWDLTNFPTYDRIELALPLEILTEGSA